MANLAKYLKDEISRLSRKTVRSELGATQKQVSVYRREIAALKRTVADQQRRLAHLEKQENRRTGEAPAARNGEERQPRFSAKWLRKHREKLGLSAADYAKLVGVSALTIYNWEGEKSRPRASQVAKLANVRGLGVREAQRRLELLQQ